jgi:hypothetical protein
MNQVGKKAPAETHGKRHDTLAVLPFSPMSVHVFTAWICAIHLTKAD